MSSNIYRGSVFDPFAEDLSREEKIKFLLSDTYCKLLTDFARGITNNHKIRVVLLPPFSEALGYTDGNTIHLCPVHEMFIDLPIDTITAYILAVAFHEPCHVMYTDFRYWVSRIRSISEGQSLYKWLFNSICDARIERIGGIEFPGVRHYLIEFRKFFLENDKNPPTSDAQILLNNILLFATCGETKYEMSDEIQTAFDACRQYIIAGRRSDTTQDCDKNVEKIFEIVYPIVKNESIMPENPTGMMSSSKNQKGFKKNAKTGGADIIEFDEDNMTSDGSDSSDGEDDGNSANASGSSSSKKNSSKSKSKSSSKKSSGSSDKDEGEEENNNGNGNGKSSSDKKDDDDSNSGSGASSDNNEEDGDSEKNASSNGKTDSNEDGEDSGTADGDDGEDGENDGDDDDNNNDKNSDNGTDNSDEGNESDNSNGSDSSNDADSNDAGGQGGDPTGSSVENIDSEASREMLRNAIEGSVPSYENEKIQKSLDANRMNDLESTATGSVNVICAKPSMSNSPLYAEITTNASSVINHLISEMRKVINWNQEEICRKQGRGFLDIQSLPYAYRGTCFARRIEKSDEAELFVSLILDSSGSMSGQRLMNTAVTTAIILEACSALKIPVSIKGFSSNYTCCDVTHYWDYQYKNPNCKQNIVQMYASGGTPLAEALRYEKEYLSKVRYADKLCFVITDGEPNSTSSAIAELAQLSKDALVYGVAIGDDVPQLTRIFGESKFIDARDIKTLPFQIGNIIKRNIIR